MILGIGTDIVEISRIKSSIEKWGETFLNKLFTEAEISYCSQNKNHYPCFAARFAAKESVIKAFAVNQVLKKRANNLIFQDLTLFFCAWEWRRGQRGD